VAVVAVSVGLAAIGAEIIFGAPFLDTVAGTIHFAIVGALRLHTLATRLDVSIIAPAVTKGIKAHSKLTATVNDAARVFRTLETHVARFQNTVSFRIGMTSFFTRVGRRKNTLLTLFDISIIAFAIKHGIEALTELTIPVKLAGRVIRALVVVLAPVHDTVARNILSAWITRHSRICVKYSCQSRNSS